MGRPSNKLIKGHLDDPQILRNEQLVYRRRKGNAGMHSAVWLLLLQERCCQVQM